MTKKQTTKRALLASALALVLCCAMLVGTTFAWFTDSVTSAGNIIKSGNLDVEMYWADGKLPVPSVETDWTDASTGAIFNYDLWEPGYTEVRHIKIANVGSLAFKYKVQIVANGEVSDLADVIDVYYVDPAVQVASRADLTADKKLGTLTEVLAGLGESANGELIAGTADTLTIALKMQESAGNEYQGLSIGTDFAVQVLATQLTSEDDSFDKFYDEDAVYQVIVNSVEELESALDNVEPGTEIVLGNDITVTEPIVIPASATGYSLRSAGNVTVIDLNGKTINTAYAAGSTTNHVYAFTNNGNLLLKNGTVNARGIFNYGDMTIENVTINAIDGNGGYAIRNYSGSTLTMNSGKIATTLEDDHLSDAGGYDATTLRVDAGSSAVINGGTIENVCDFTSAIENYGTVVVNDAKITAIHTAVYNKGTMTFNGGSVSCGMNGTTRHTIYDLGGKVTINGGTFINTATDQNATGASVINGNVEVNGGTFNGRVENYYGTPVIKGGTFSVEPRANFVAAGYKVTNNSDGTWTVGAYTVSTATEFVDAITNGKAVELTQDINLGKIDLTNAITNDVDINANGHKITTADSYGIEVTAGKNITISNADVEMTKPGDYITYAAGFKIANGDYAGSTITLKNCAITMANTDWAYAVNMPASVKNLNLVIDNCTLEGAVAVQCWGDNNTITITNSKLICNYTTSAMYTSYCVVLQDDGYNAAENNTLVIDGCEFQYSGIDNFNSSIYAVDDRNGSNTVTVTNCIYGEKIVG